MILNRRRGTYFLVNREEPMRQNRLITMKECMYLLAAEPGNAQYAELYAAAEKVAAASGEVEVVEQDEIVLLTEMKRWIESVEKKLAEYNRRRAELDDMMTMAREALRIARGNQRLIELQIGVSA